MSDATGLQKIKFFFDKYANEPFHETQETHEIMLTYPGNVTGEGDVIAKIVDFDEPEYTAKDSDLDELPTAEPSALETEYVMYNAKTKEFISKMYGFISYKDKQITIKPLSWITKDKLECYFYIHTTLHKKFPSLSEIKKWYDILNLIHIVEDYNINYQLDLLKEDPNKAGKPILVAEGVKPIDGVVEKIELRKVLEHKVGTELEDGRIDYKEKDVFYTVVQGEVIAEKIPEVPAKDGVDIYGNMVDGLLTGESLYKLGKNLEPQEEGSNYYVASEDGVLDIAEDNKLSIEESLIVNGDVDLNTGHIRFPGMVEITGNVQPGFEVEADKDVYIRGNVEDAQIKAGGSITIENGILGKEQCKVEAKGNIKARFIQNSEVITDKSIKIHESIVQGKCFSREHIKVDGKVVGGELYGLFGIVVATAGAASGTKTILVSGKDPELEQEIDVVNTKITENLNSLKDNIDEITQYFGENILTEVKTVIATLPKHRQKQLLTLLQKIKEINTVVSDFKKQREKLKASLVFPKPPFIEVKEDTFPGVTVRIKNSVKKIDTKIPHKAKFVENPKTKTISWE